MRKHDWWLATGIACVFSLMCFIPLPIWLAIFIASAAVYPFSLVLLRENTEVASILAAFVFCFMAYSHYTSISSLIGYGAYVVTPLFLLRYQQRHPREFSKPLFLETLTLVLYILTFVVGLWWIDSPAFVKVPSWLKIWPGCAALISGTYVTTLFMEHDFSADRTPFHATLIHYGSLAVMLFLAIALEDAQGVFLNMSLAALLPFTLETVSKVRYKWGERSRTTFSILMGCATITIVPLYIFGLYALFSPWINHCFKKGVK